MRLRAIGAVAVLALAMSCLTACRTNVGLAADVGGQRITESKVAGYLRPGGPDAKAHAKLKAQGETIPPARVVTLQLLINEKLYENTFKSRGGVPSAGRLASYHDKLAQNLTGNRVEKAIRQFLDAAGIDDSFTDVYVRFLELRVALIADTHATSEAQFDAIVRKGGGTVRVNPRYGTWNAKQLILSGGRTDGVPGFLKLQPAAGST